MDEYSLILNNKRIYEFYSRNKNISFEAVNLIFLDLLEKLNSDMSSAMTNTINGEILSSVKELKGLVATMNNTLIIKIQDINKEYTQNVKLIVEKSSSDNITAFVSALDKNTELFVSRINAELPKNNTELNTKMNENLRSFQETISQDMRTHFSSNNESSIKDYINNLDEKIKSIQTPIYSFITSNQQQITNNLTSLKESNLIAQTNQCKVIDELGDFLNKYKTNSAAKGLASENRLQILLNKMFPMSNVVDSRALKEAGDFLLKREGRPTILIENKNYEANINIDEIKKFLRDINSQNCSGIFISQNSGVVGKPNYFIEMHGGHVLIYLHNVDYSEEKIKCAVDIIDNLSKKYAEITNNNQEDGVKITKEFLDKINTEYQVFLNQRDLLVFNIKESQKKVILQIEELKFPDLSTYLNEIYGSVQNQQFLCDICNESFSKKSSLASHKKKHK
jgi:hypothetical protein